MALSASAKGVADAASHAAYFFARYFSRRRYAMMLHMLLLIICCRHGYTPPRAMPPQFDSPFYAR